MNTQELSKRALVTGASSGIGKAYAELLAAGGTDLVVVARSRERLEELAGRLRTTHGRDVEILVADLENREQLAQVEARLRDHDDIDLLINNAGYGFTGAFADVPIERAQGQIDCNIVALTRLSHAALHSMKKARRGSILNVASGAAFLPTPNIAVYCATKAYVVSFTQALAEELKRDGIKASVVCPGFTKTEFQQRAQYDASMVPSFAWQTPEQVARESLEALRTGKVICVPGVQNKILRGVLSVVPQSMLPSIAGKFAGSQQKAAH